MVFVKRVKEAEVGVCSEEMGIFNPVDSIRKPFNECVFLKFSCGAAVPSARDLSKQTA